MHKQIAGALMEAVFFEVSVLVSLNGQGEVLYVSLFSTAFPPECVRVAAEAKEIWLISNHPEGNPEPYAQDIRNYCSLARQRTEVLARFFLYSAYFSCFEVKLPITEGECDIMDEIKQ